MIRADGSGAGGAIIIAKLTNLAALGAGHFTIVSGFETAPPPTRAGAIDWRPANDAVAPPEWLA